jgi:hypothetical protein
MANMYRHFGIMLLCWLSPYIDEEDITRSTGAQWVGIPILLYGVFLSYFNYTS